MRNMYTPASTTSVNTKFGANTFSGQSMDGVWVSRVQTSCLSPALRTLLVGVWETPTGSTQDNRSGYTGFTTTLSGRFSDEGNGLYPQSTRPIKIDSKVYKENRS